MLSWSTGLALACGLLASFAIPSALRADIDLEWRPALQTVYVGDTVDIGLYAVSDLPETNQSISAMDVILSWPAESLEFVGAIDNGPYDWLVSTFPDDSGLDGLNNTFADGSALYFAYAALGNPAWATPDGLLVTTLRFTALAETPETVLTILAETGQYSRTAVFDGETAGLDVHGALGNAKVTILALPGNCDHDLDVDLRDYATLRDCLSGPDSGPPTQECQCADLDEDGDVDLEDFAGFQLWHSRGS
jgi:hypothetical protein